MKVVISSRSFGKINSDAINLLKKQGLEPVLNPLGRKLSEEEILNLIDNNVVGIIAGTENITKKVITQASSLKVISRYGVGMENIDLEAANQKGVLVYNTPDTPATAVSELTLSLILNLLRKISKLDRNIKNNDWKAEMGNLLAGKTVGILGLGRIGKKLVRLLEPFNTNIFVYEAKPDNEFIKKHNITISTLDEILTKCDIITIHLPLTPETKHIIGEKELSRMKENAILINTARGELLDENALYNVLKDNIIRGAAIDAFKEEPYQGRLIELDNVILTPHIGTATIETRKDMEIEASSKLIDGLKEKKIL
jgi:D-3-phosphoglycerate dehydrogenase